MDPLRISFSVAYFCIILVVSSRVSLSLLSEADLLVAIGHIAKSIGMTKIAQESGLSRPSLYKALSDGSKPQFDTIIKILKAIGLQIQINPLSPKEALVFPT